MNNIILLGLVSLINDFSSKIILPIMPLYVAQIGGAGLAIGLLSGLGETLSSFLKVISGHWSDKLGKRKPFILFGYLLSAVSKMMLYFSKTWPMVLLFRSTERVGKGVRSAARDAMIAAAAAEEKRGRAFGLHRTFDTGGAVLGSLAVLAILVFTDWSFSKIFLLAGIIAVFSAIPAFFTKETGQKKPASKTKLIVSFKQLSPRLRGFIVIGTVFALGNFSWMFFVLKAQGIFSQGNELIIPVILYTIYNFSYMLLAYPVGKLADKIGKDKVLITGYAFFGLLTLGFILFESLFAYVLLFLFYGVMYAFVESNERAYVSDLAGAENRGTALGTFFTLTSLVTLPAGLITGWLYDMNPDYAFAFGMGISLLTVILFAFNMVTRRRAANI